MPTHEKILRTIAGIGAAYGARGGLPVRHVQPVAERRPVTTPWDPMPCSPIHDDAVRVRRPCQVHRRVGLRRLVEQAPA